MRNIPRPTHDNAQLRSTRKASDTTKTWSTSIIRTMTVGSGVSPDLLTFVHNKQSARGLLIDSSILSNHRRWGISPRPEVRLSKINALTLNPSFYLGNKYSHHHNEILHFIFNKLLTKYSVLLYTRYSKIHIH